MNGVDRDGRNYTVCGLNGKDCSKLSSDQYGEFLKTQGVKNVSGNKLILTGKDGSSTAIGTADYYDEKVFSRTAAAQIAGDSMAGIRIFAAAQALFATSYLGTYGLSTGWVALSALGRTGAIGPSVGLLELAQKYGLNLNSAKARQFLDNLDTSVEEFIGKFRQGSIKQAEGWKFVGMTVRQALDAGGRKLVTDGRFDKAK